MRILKRILVGLFVTLAVLVSLFLLLYFTLFIIGAAQYGEARDLRKYVCTIPEINSGFAPQGVTNTADGEYILTGYGKDNVSLLYIVSDKGYRKVSLSDGEGGVLKGHAGGVACKGNNVFIANDYKLVQFDLTELKTSDAAVAPKRVVPVDNRAAYCSIDGDMLYVGEFFREQNYKTDPAHHFTAPSGETNKAIVSCYKLDGDELAHGQPYPEYCISVTSLVQGFAAHDGVAVLSRSYGLKNSKLEYHTLPTEAQGEVTVTFKHNDKAEQKTVPLYFLDTDTNFRTLTLPAFSEDITIVDDRVVVTNEASANSYIVGKFFAANKVYSYPMATPEEHF